MIERLIVLGRQRGISHFWLYAQTEAVPFYTRLGFLPRGEVFIDAGIPHQEMVRSVAGSPIAKSET